MYILMSFKFLIRVQNTSFFYIALASNYQQSNKQNTFTLPNPQVTSDKGERVSPTGWILKQSLETAQ
jgi:hypothetical protein